MWMIIAAIIAGTLLAEKLPPHLKDVEIRYQIKPEEEDEDEAHD